MATGIFSNTTCWRKKEHESSIDPIYAYAHATLDDGTIKLSGFSSGDELFASLEDFMAFQKRLPIFFTQRKSLFFKDLIRQGSTLVYINDFPAMSKSKAHLLQFIKQSHDFAIEESPNLAPETRFFMLLTVKYLCHEKAFDTNKPIHSQKAGIHKNCPPTTKTTLMRFDDSMKFSFKFFDKLQDNVNLLKTYFMILL